MGRGGDGDGGGGGARSGGGDGVEGGSVEGGGGGGEGSGRPPNRSKALATLLYGVRRHGTPLAPQGRGGGGVKRMIGNAEEARRLGELGLRLQGSGSCPQLSPAAVAHSPRP